METRDALRIELRDKGNAARRVATDCQRGAGRQRDRRRPACLIIVSLGAEKLACTAGRGRCQMRWDACLMCTSCIGVMAHLRAVNVKRVVPELWVVAARMGGLPDV